MYNNRFEFYEHLESFQESIDVYFILYQVKQIWVECENRAGETVRITTELNLRQFEKEKFKKKQINFDIFFTKLLSQQLKLMRKKYQNKMKINM